MLEAQTRARKWMKSRERGKARREEEDGEEIITVGPFLSFHSTLPAAESHHQSWDFSKGPNTLTDASGWEIHGKSWARKKPRFVCEYAA